MARSSSLWPSLARSSPLWPELPRPDPLTGSQALSGYVSIRMGVTGIQPCCDSRSIVQSDPIAAPVVDTVAAVTVGLVAVVVVAGRLVVVDAAHLFSRLPPNRPVSIWCGGDGGDGLGSYRRCQPQG